MPTNKGSESGAQGSKKGKTTIKKKFAPSTDPIIITGGGSIYLEYANKSVDGFSDNSSGGGKKKLKHKRNTAGKAELTRIDVFHPKNGTAPVQTIDLKSLGINGDCRIEIHYDFE